MAGNQTHPLHTTDKTIIDSLIAKQNPDNFDLINLARLINRYDNFPGELELKSDMEKILKFWKLSKEDIFFQTRKLWSNNFRPPSGNNDLVGSGFDASN